MAEPKCPTTPQAEMYGLGIRLGFYFQWLAGALAALLNVPGDVVAVRSALFAFTLAVFIALLVQAHGEELTPADMYITLLLCFGYFYSWPLKIFMNQTRVVASMEFDILQHLLLVAVCGFKLWFWLTKVLDLKEKGSEGGKEYGFLFSRKELDSDRMRGVNIAVDICVLFMVFYFRAAVVYKVNKKIQARGEIPYKPDNKKCPAYEFAGRVAVSALIITATELSIRWNHPKCVNELGSTGQMIPLILGATILLHTLYRWKVPDKEPLLWAAKHGHNYIAWLLIYLGADIEATDKTGYTPLMLAVTNGHPDTVKMLLDKAAAREAKTENDRTPLMLAAEKGDKAVTRVLLDQYANCGRTDKEGWTPLMLAVENQHQAVAEMLTKQVHKHVFGSQLDVMGYAGWTPLMLAIHKKDHAIAGMLLDEGAGINAKGRNGRTPLILAAMDGDRTTVEFLMGRGADPEVEDENGWTPLMWAVWDQNQDAAEALLDKGAKVEKGDNDCLTPLCIAVYKDSLELVKLLHGDYGADPDCSIRLLNRGPTAREFASKNNCNAISDVFPRRKTHEDGLVDESLYEIKDPRRL